MKDYSHDLNEIENLNKPDLFIQSIIKWHFSEETGSEFWLKIRSELEFDPIKEVNTFSDLKKFPDFSERLRTVPVEQLIPRGLKDDKNFSVYESGGTTGAPKYVIAYDAWINNLVDWRMSSYKNRPGRPTGNTLAAVPTGPHIVGAINKIRAKALGGVFFSIDIDPRWVKQLISKNEMQSVRSYSSHLVEQIRNTLLTQQIRFLVTTPPILRALLKDESLVEHMRKTLVQITLGGTEIDLDEVKFIATEILPECEFSASYGSTSALGVSRSSLIHRESLYVEYDNYSPFITYEVVNAATQEPVNYGQRGQVIVSHLSRYAFYPRVIERDTAIRLEGKQGQVGDRVANISPLRVVEGNQVIEGVY
ncbi:AMP-binding protein [Photobacterium halotolerans]|uniref:AMP-binding protein n=1 Tax=Photobacterium halotolerans TaxID=265726 RepID=UPI0003FF9848|nr:AMP-binding protein [Photobacterium halotolerans]